MTSTPQFQALTTQFGEYARIPDVVLTREEMQMDGMVRQMWITSSTGDIMFANGWLEGQVPAVLGVENIMADLQKELGVQRDEVIPRTLRDAGKALSTKDVLLPYTMSAMFMVSRDAIRSNPIELYTSVRKYLLYDDTVGKDMIAKSKSGPGMYTCEWFRQASAAAPVPHAHCTAP